MSMNYSGDYISDSDGVKLKPSSSVMRNRIINGDMRIDQRNAGAATANTINGYTLDRWYVTQSVTGKIIVQQNSGSVTPPTGFTNYLGITSQSAYSLGADDYYMLGQFIEGYNVADLNWGTANAKTVTLSFWVRSSLTGTFGGALTNGDLNRSYPFTYTISSANTWTQASVTIAGDTTGTWFTTNAAGFKVWFGLGVGTTYSGTAGSWSGNFYLSATGATSVVGTSGATFYITGVQLEVGSSATGFEYRQYGQELALCQRYYQTWGFSPLGFSAIAMGCLNSSTASCRISFPVKMRAAPSCSIVGTINTDYQVYFNGGYRTLSAAGVSGDTTADSLRLDAQTSGLYSGGGSALFYIQTTSGGITASAEL